jgi:type I restriction enzyme M protein
VPKQLVVARFFPSEQEAIASLEMQLGTIKTQLAELEEEHSGEDGCLGALDKINKTEVSARLRKIKDDPEAQDEITILQEWIKLNETESALKKQIKDASDALDKLAYEKYATLTEEEVKTLVVDDKWLTAISEGIKKELDRVSQSLTGRMRQLAERYATPLPQLVAEVQELSAKVTEHLKRMEMSYDI